jgi:hypothetical protein
MNQKNIDFLKDTLKYMGFDDRLNTDLEKNIQEDKPEFQLKNAYEFNKQAVSVELFFKKGGQQPLYYFNKYRTTINIKDGQRSQLFYNDKSNGLTLKEAFNLLQGRAVYKELANKAGEEYKAWIQLDFNEKEESGNFKQKIFHENYGYQLIPALEKLPIQELKVEKQKDILVKSLKKGNVQSVSFEKDGQIEKMFVEANPQFKTITVYDGQMKMLKKKEADTSKAK